MSFRIRRNKSELIVLTGAIYSFVAYLTAFTLEILFLIDLTRRGNELLSSPPGPITASSADRHSPEVISAAAAHTQAANAASLSSSFDRFAFEALQAHITISCLAISILYFVLFITSLILIVALILRSTFVLLIWMCAMATMYLPEFGLVTYVAVYSWGLETRNGQTELAFYLFRAVLNLIFIFRAHKLFKQWNYEKNFFRLKSGSAGGLSVGHHFGGYDSPFFISGDSLSTTINPVFSSSTLNLNRYDYVRGGSDLAGSHAAGSRNTSPTTNQSVFSADLNGDSSQQSSMAGGRGRLAAASLYSRELANAKSAANLGRDSSYDLERTQASKGQFVKAPNKFYLGEPANMTPAQANARSRYHANLSGGGAANKQAIRRHQSLLSINDDLDADYEMDLDYRTINRQEAHQQARLSTPTSQHRGDNPPSSARYHNSNNNHRQLQPQHRPDATGRYNQPQQQAMISRSQDNLTYSTQSLDRRGNARDFGFNEQVVLRPLGHQPFGYLQYWHASSSPSSSS